MIKEVWRGQGACRAVPKKVRGRFKGQRSGDAERAMRTKQLAKLGPGNTDPLAGPMGKFLQVCERPECVSSRVLLVERIPLDFQE